jgi:hypothetical protein
VSVGLELVPEIRRLRGRGSTRSDRDPDQDREGGGGGGTDVLVEEVAVDGPVERVLERPAVEQAHPLLLRRPPRQVPRRRRHRPRRRSFVLSFPFSLSSLLAAVVVGLGGWGSDSDAGSRPLSCLWAVWASSALGPAHFASRFLPGPLYTLVFLSPLCGGVHTHLFSFLFFGLFQRAF